MSAVTDNGGVRILNEGAANSVSIDNEILTVTTTGGKAPTELFKRPEMEEKSSE